MDCATYDSVLQNTAVSLLYKALNLFIMDGTVGVTRTATC
jgi:hypothetical protein